MLYGIYVRILVVVVKKSAVRPLKQQQQKVRKMWTRKSLHDLPQCFFFIYLFFIGETKKHTHEVYHTYLYLSNIMIFLLNVTWMDEWYIIYMRL